MITFEVAHKSSECLLFLVIIFSLIIKKKVLFCAALAVCLGAGITTAVHVTQAANRASAMMLENAEALAESEVFGNVVCYTDGSGSLCAKVYDSNGRNPKKFYYYN